MHTRTTRSAMAVHLLIAVIVAPSLGSTHAQTKSRSTSRAANVQTGTVVAVDGTAGTLILKPRTGPDITYHLTDKTHVLKSKKTVDATEFKSGDAVVVRFRRSTAGPASLYDMADKASWEWLDRLRHETTPVTVVEATDESLKAAEGADRAEVDYRVTEKTAWQKSGKPAAATDFKAGDRVYVVPRLLPSGSIMASAVSDAQEGAAVLKERSRSTVSGVVKALDGPKRALRLHTVAGEEREIVLAPDVVVRQASKDVPLTILHPGLNVSVRLARTADNEVEASRITIQSRKTFAKKPARVAKPVVKVPVKP
jgi:hypothetical protein